MQVNFTNKRVLITGGTRGIGLASALAFGRRGARCALTYSWGGDEEDAARALLDAGAPAPLLIQADVSRDADTADLMNTLARELGGVDVFISNVAMGRPAATLDALTRNDLQKAVGYSAWPLVDYTRALWQTFGHAPRYVVGISSFGAEHFYPAYDALGAAKAALETLCRYLAHHLHPEGIRVNIVRAGFVPTRALEATLGKEVVPFTAARNHLMKTEEIADAIVALCSGFMDGYTGQILSVDHGVSFFDNPMHRYAVRQEDL